jgi:hypothetical protein
MLGHNMNASHTVLFWWTGKKGRILSNVLIAGLTGDPLRILTMKSLGLGVPSLN